MNLNQIHQRLEGSRSWHAAPSSFVGALKALFARSSNSRRTGIFACGHVELLEIRQVLSTANPASTLNFPAVCVAEDLTDASGSDVSLQPSENTAHSGQQKPSDQTDISDSDSSGAKANYSNIRGKLEFDLISDSFQTNGNGQNSFRYPAINYFGSSSLVISSTQSAESKSSVGESSRLTTSNLGQLVARDNDTSLIDFVFQHSDSILDSSLSNSSPIGSNKSEDESASLPKLVVTQQNSISAPTTIAPQVLKQGTVEANSKSVVWQDAASSEVSPNIELHWNNQSRSPSRPLRDFVARSMKETAATELRLSAESHAAKSRYWSPETDSANNDIPDKITDRSWRGVLSNLEELYAGIDLFKSPSDSSIVADKASQSTLAFIADETLPIAVPRLTPEITPSHSTQNLPNMTPTRVKQLREGHRQHSDAAVVSTDIVQHDGASELVTSENIPRQFKHVVLPRGPPRKQPATVLRIMDSDAEAHVLQRLRYSIAPRGPSTVTVEMQSPEESSFSGPRVSPEETCHVRLAC